MTVIPGLRPFDGRDARQLVTRVLAVRWPDLIAVWYPDGADRVELTGRPGDFLRTTQTGGEQATEIRVKTRFGSVGEIPEHRAGVLHVLPADGVWRAGGAQLRPVRVPLFDGPPIEAMLTFATTPVVLSEQLTLTTKAMTTVARAAGVSAEELATASEALRRAIDRSVGAAVAAGEVGPTC